MAPGGPRASGAATQLQWDCASSASVCGHFLAWGRAPRAHSKPEQQRLRLGQSSPSGQAPEFPSRGPLPLVGACWRVLFSSSNLVATGDWKISESCGLIRRFFARIAGIAIPAKNALLAVLGQSKSRRARTKRCLSAGLFVVRAGEGRKAERRTELGAQNWGANLWANLGNCAQMCANAHEWQPVCRSVRECAPNMEKRA